MLRTRTPLADLAPADRAELEHRLVGFDLSWRAGALRAEIDRLPDETAWRWAAVVEFVKIDLERCWRAGTRPTLADYLLAVPDLGPQDDLPAELIAVEYQLRTDFGEPATLTDLTRRFPAQAAQVRRLIGAAVETCDRHQKSGETAPRLTPVTAPVPVQAAPAPDQMFGRYRIVRLLGRGGMGAVYLAHDPHLKRDVALKIPSPELTADPRALDLMLREAQAAAQLRHPNICPVHDAGVIDGTPFITSLYVQGEPLSALAKRTPPVEQLHAAKLVAAVARALEYAHRNGIIHRDLKPANIMLDATGQPVVTDFGLARRVQTGQPSHATMTGLFGSPAYMAPEQIAETKAGPASDLFSLGVVLYELLTGRVPFRGTPEQVFEQLVHSECPPPARFRPDLDPRLEAICLKALEKDPAARYQRMAEFAEALDALTGAAPRRRWRALVLGAAVLLTAGVVAVVAVLLDGLGNSGGRKTRTTAAGDGGTGAGQDGQPQVPVDGRFRPAFEGVRDFNRALFKPPDFNGKEPTTAAEWAAAVNDPEPANRYLAILKVGATNNTAAIPNLVWRLSRPEVGGPPGQGEHWAMRRECAAALGALGQGNGAAADALVQRVADKLWLDRTRINIDADRWRNPFAGGFIQDPECGGKGAALAALDRIAPGRVKEALELAEKSPRLPVSNWATLELKELAKRKK